jgi:hypothetical protein
MGLNHVMKKKKKVKSFTWETSYEKKLNNTRDRKICIFYKRKHFIWIVINEFYNKRFFASLAII